MDQPVDPATADTPPLCPECRQPVTVSLGGNAGAWECRNEACPEYGTPAMLDSDAGSHVVDHHDDDHPSQPAP